MTTNKSLPQWLIDVWEREDGHGIIAGLPVSTKLDLIQNCEGNLIKAYTPGFVSIISLKFKKKSWIDMEEFESLKGFKKKIDFLESVYIKNLPESSRL